MDILGLSLVGILVTTLSGIRLGALWYSPTVFGKQWLQCIGKTPETLGSTVAPMIGNILTAMGIAIIFSMMEVGSLIGVSVLVQPRVFLLFSRLYCQTTSFADGVISFYLFNPLTVY